MAVLLKYFRAVFSIALVVLVALSSSGSAQKEAAAEIPPVALRTKGFDTKLLDPVDGITVREYAHIVFEMFAGEADADRVIAAHKLTKPRFDAITTEMTERFRKDPTFKYAEIYAAYYQETAGGKYEAYAKDYAQSVLNGGPLKEKEPMNWGRYMELQKFYADRAMAVKPTTRAASDAVLAEKGLTFIDYQVLGAWFGRRLAVQSGR